MRIARAVIAPDAAGHRVKGRVDRSDSRPSRRAGGLSSWRRAFCRLAFQPRGVCADTGVYAVVKEQRRARILFNELVLSDKLFEHCAEIDETARNRMELIVRSLAEQNGVTEQLKAENQMEWVRQMNACKAQAEEVVKAELIYN